MNDKELAEIKKEVKALSKLQRKPRPKENYRIVRLNPLDDDKPVTVEKFYAENDEAANDYLVQFRLKSCQTAGDSNNMYFWKYANYHVGPDGEYYDDLNEMLDSKDDGFWRNLKIWWYVHVTSNISDAWYWFKDLFYWIKHKQNRRDSWDIYYALLRLLEHNIPILINNHCGVPTCYCVEARKKLNANNPDFDVDESFKEQMTSSEEEIELASKLYEEELRNLLLAVRLHEYYEGYGIVDPKNTAMVQIDAAYNGTLPYKKGSWKEFDYVKLNVLVDKYHNQIFDTLKKIGPCLWD